MIVYSVHFPDAGIVKFGRSQNFKKRKSCLRGELRRNGLGDCSPVTTNTLEIQCYSDWLSTERLLTLTNIFGLDRAYGYEWFKSDSAVSIPDFMGVYPDELFTTAKMYSRILEVVDEGDDPRLENGGLEYLLRNTDVSKDAFYKNIRSLGWQWPIQGGDSPQTKGAADMTMGEYFEKIGEKLEPHGNQTTQGGSG